VNIVHCVVVVSGGRCQRNSAVITQWSQRPSDLMPLLPRINAASLRAQHSGKRSFSRRATVRRRTLLGRWYDRPIYYCPR